jgi:hypothetical protein
VTDYVVNGSYQRLSFVVFIAGADVNPPVIFIRVEADVSTQIDGNFGLAGCDVVCAVVVVGGIDVNGLFFDDGYNRTGSQITPESVLAEFENSLLDVAVAEPYIRAVRFAVDFCPLNLPSSDIKMVLCDDELYPVAAVTLNSAVGQVGLGVGISQLCEI